MIALLSRVAHPTERGRVYTPRNSLRSEKLTLLARSVFGALWET